MGGIQLLVLKASVESVMRRPPVTTLFSDTISSIAEKMVSKNIGAVIIMSGGTPTGIVTERDIVEKIVRARRDPNKTRAQEVMSSPLLSIEVDRSVADALRLMRDRKTRRLAVTRKGRLVGIVTERRILDSLA
ncbi:MAG: CBS domain-containing protein [Candidatus Bathyarchaeota archaeon]|nr:CBS domain-containing protein [Candidatus Bathyarchaeota archaeon]